jgi:lipoprotein-releasing system permease protein
VQTTGYESLVGWRYLLRQKRRPRILLIGLGVIAVGLGLLLYGVHLQSAKGATISVFATQSNLPQTLMQGGGGVAAFGMCLALFGFFNTFMTVFSAFSSFMITIGVAEVLLVLGVMNGFQGDLRNKIINTYAHVVIESQTPGEYLADYEALAAQARAIDGVMGATPVLRTEVMLNSQTNLAAVALQGIDRATIRQTSLLPDQLKIGCLAALTEGTAACRHWVIERAYELNPPPVVEALAMGSIIGVTGDGLTTTPPAVEPVAEEDDEMAFPAPRLKGKRALPGFFVGAELRRNLALWPNEVVNVVSPLGELGPQGPVPKSRPFRLMGWFESGMLEFDTKLAYASLPAVQAYMGVGDVASAIQVKVADLEGARAIRDQLRSTLPAGVRVSDWQERNRNLFSALKLEKVAMFLVLTINILLAAFSIMSTLVMTIIERKREVAILKAMGAHTSGVLRIFMSQGLFTGVVGSLFGTLIGVGGGLILANLDLPLNQDVYYISAIPVDVRVWDVVTIVVVALLVSLASTIYPALYASKLRPVEGLTAE